MSKKALSRSASTAAKTMYAALQILKEAGGEMPSKDITKLVGQKVTLSDWEKGRLEKTGNIRWESIMHFYSIDFLKAGFLRKQKGVRILTNEGEDAVINNSPEDLLHKAGELYKKRDLQRKKEHIDEFVDELDNENIVDSREQQHKVELELLESKALEGLREHVVNMNPYDFQDLVGALLRAMGYYTPFIAPKGKDGGIDLVAYSDPLGGKPPRIKIQVKHRPNASISIDEIQRMRGLLNNGSDVGIIVTSGKFTRDSEIQARNGSIHIELIDFERLMELRQQFYIKLSDEDKNKLPLHSIYFLGSNE